MTRTALKSKAVWKFVLPGTGLLFLFLAGGCRHAPAVEAEVPSIGVRTATVRFTDYVIPVRCAGRLSAKTESRLSFKTGGIVERIPVEEGQSVRKGELLAELNTEEIRSQVRQTELALQKAQRDFRRAGNLYRDSVATLEQFENARTALDVARANVRIARFNLQYSSIRAPDDGRILKRLAETHEIVGGGHPVILFASTGGDWVVRCSLADRDIIRVHMLDSAAVCFDAFGDTVFGGLISEIGSAADPYTGTYEVEIRLTEKPEKLVSGLIARMELFPAGRTEQIVIAYEALVEGSGLTGYVYIVRDGMPWRTRIRIESFSDRGIVVKSGLDPGDEIVVEGAQYLREGSRIKIIGQKI
jgi:RND family efflux transporter MFP subunit